MPRHPLVTPLLLVAALAGCGGEAADRPPTDAEADSLAPNLETGTTGAPGPGTTGTPGTEGAPDPDTL